MVATEFAGEPWIAVTEAIDTCSVVRAKLIIVVTPSQREHLVIG